jgi:hypothetical protein
VLGTTIDRAEEEHKKHKAAPLVPIFLSDIFLLKVVSEGECKKLNL